MTDDVERPDPAEVRAAGGVVWRRMTGGGLEVLVVHRPRYDDWTFPKGKLDPGEGWELAAVREVWEETGAVVLLGPELPGSTYRDRHGRPKRVRYWAATVAAETGFTPGDEVDERRWVPVADAAALLSYPRDRDVLAGLSTAIEGSPSSG